jgi:hypothetical protein
MRPILPKCALVVEEEVLRVDLDHLNASIQSGEQCWGGMKTAPGTYWCLL